jgi:hypothetical protein
MTAETAREFVAGRLFHYACFDGTSGVGRIFNDGSVAGTMQPLGRGPQYYVRLPAGTLYVQNNQVCASIKGLFFSPCFNLTRTSDTGFRGSISGLSFMYCEFDRSGRTRLARKQEKSRGGVLAGAGPTSP